jgi:hypothetical protein
MIKKAIKKSKDTQDVIREFLDFLSSPLTVMYVSLPIFRRKIEKYISSKKLFKE